MRCPSRLARRPRHRRGGQRHTRGVRPQVGRRHRRPLRSRDPQARSQARRDRPQLRRAAHPDPRRPGTFRGLGGHRSRAVPRRAPPADLGIALGVAGAEATRRTATGRCRSPSSSSATASPTRSSEDEARSLYEKFAVPGSGEPIFQAAAANLNPWTEAKVDSKNPDRGPLLIISGELDHTVPPSIANASYKREAQPGDHRDRRDQGTRSLTRDRRRVERCGADRARVREAIRLTRVERGRDREPAIHADPEEALRSDL